METRIPSSSTKLPLRDEDAFGDFDVDDFFFVRRGVLVLSPPTERREDAGESAYSPLVNFGVDGGGGGGSFWRALRW